MTDDNEQDLGRLVRRLHRRNPVRKAVEAHAAGTIGSAQVVEACIVSLVDPDGRRWRERAAAAERLGGLPLDPEQRWLVAEALLQVLERDVYTSYGRELARVYMAVTPNSVAVGLCLLWVMRRVGLFHAQGVLDQAAGIVVVTTIIALALMVAVWPAAHSAVVAARKLEQNRVRMSAARSLGRLGCAAAATPLARELTAPSISPKPTYWGALLQVLPGLKHQPPDGADHDLSRLLVRLLGIRGAAADVAILDALAKVGGGEAVHAVERAAVSSRDPNVRAAAEGALPIVLERAELERSSGRLVRPATSPDDASSVLLRPVSPHCSADDDLLVRPAASDGRSSESRN